jgi:hypothetical protein
MVTVREPVHELVAHVAILRGPDAAAAIYGAGEVA